MRSKYIVLIFSDNIGNPSNNFNINTGIAGLLHCNNFFLKPMLKLGIVLNRKVILPLPWICLSNWHNKKNILDKNLNWDSFYNLENYKNILELKPPFSFGERGNIITNKTIGFYPSNINLNSINNNLDIIALVNLNDNNYKLKLYSRITASMNLSETKIKIENFYTNEDLKKQAQIVINKLQLKNFVFIHIRRGDYLYNKSLAPPEGTKSYTSPEIISSYIKSKFNKDKQIIIATNEFYYKDYTDKLGKLVDNNLIYEYDLYKILDQKYIKNNYFFYLILDQLADYAEINVITRHLRIGSKYHDSLEKFYYNV